MVTVASRSGWLFRVVLVLVAVSLGAAASGQVELRVALGTDPITFDPHAGADYDNYSVNQHIFRNLYLFNENFEPVPDLAESYVVSEDELEWTFALKHGVEFHDGTPFTAHDVVATLERLLDPERGLAHRSSFQFVEEVVAVDDHTVRIITREPYAPLLGQFATPPGAILSASDIEAAEDALATSPNGTGPYRLVERVVGERVVLERFDGYVGPQSHYERIVFLPVPEEQTRIGMLTRGEIDVAARISPHEVPRLEENPDIDVIAQPTNIIFAQLNTANPPLDDRRVRQALNYAIDKDLLVAAILGGTARVSTSVHTPNVTGQSPVGPYPYDPDRARALLEEAGATGFELNFVAPQGRYLLDRQVAEAISQQMRDVGVDVRLNVIGDWSTYVDTIWQTEQDMNLLGWGSGAGDIDPLLFRVFHSTLAGQPWNLSNYADPYVDALIEQGRSTTDHDERMSVYRELQEYLFVDAPWVFLHDQTSFMGVRSDVEGAFILPSELMMFWLARER
jgi:peptide/nickel transport system substrate-binding protein